MTTPLTTAQAAERLGISRRMVQTYCASGRIQAARHGLDYLIEAKEIERFARIPRRVGKPPKPK